MVNGFVLKRSLCNVSSACSRQKCLITSLAMGLHQKFFSGDTTNFMIQVMYVVPAPVLFLVMLVEALPHRLI